MNELVERGRTVYRKAAQTQRRNGVIIVLLGAAFVIMGFIGIYNGEAREWPYFLIAAGVLFAAVGLNSLISARRLGEK